MTLLLADFIGLLAHSPGGPRTHRHITTQSSSSRAPSLLSANGSPCGSGQCEEHHWPAAPSVRRVTGWITRHLDSLPEEDAAGLKAVLAGCQEPEQVHRHVAAFGTMMSKRTGSNLRIWIEAVYGDAASRSSAGSADGLLADFDAVTAGLTLPYSSGITEGAVNCIRALKRETFGRDGFPLLRKRILLA